MLTIENDFYTNPGNASGPSKMDGPLLSYFPSRSYGPMMRPSTTGATGELAAM
jgi:hypothetical protein